MAITLDQAKSVVRMSLDIASGDADMVARSLSKAQRNARQYLGYTTDEDDHYAMLRLALSDITGEAAYRTMR